jgi:hypothetical protein
MSACTSPTHINFTHAFIARNYYHYQFSPTIGGKSEYFARCRRKSVHRRQMFFVAVFPDNCRRGAHGHSARDARYSIHQPQPTHEGEGCG